MMYKYGHCLNEDLWVLLTCPVLAKVLDRIGSDTQMHMNYCNITTATIERKLHQVYSFIHSSTWMLLQILEVILTYIYM